MKKIILVSLASTLLFNTAQVSAMASNMTMKEPSNVMINYNPGLLFVNF